MKRMALVIAVMLCLHDPAIVQQTESKTAKQQNSKTVMALFQNGTRENS